MVQVMVFYLELVALMLGQMLHAQLTPLKSQVFAIESELRQFHEV